MGKNRLETPAVDAMLTTKQTIEVIARVISSCNVSLRLLYEVELHLLIHPCDRFSADEVSVQLMHLEDLH